MSFGTGDPEMARSVTVGGEFSVRSRAEDCWDDPPSDVAVYCVPGVPEGLTYGFNIIHRTDGIKTPSNTEYRFSYSTVAGTATEGVDYEEASGTFAIAVGDASTPEAHVPTLQDALDESDEVFAVHIVGMGETLPFRDGFTDAYVVKPILDDDDQPSVSIADASGLEDAVGNLPFDVTLNTASGKKITLDYATADGGATEGSDYTGRSGTLTFDPGDTKKTVEVTVTTDDIHEADETFTVRLS